MIEPKSMCLDCGIEFEHDRFHMLCPSCGSFATKLIAGREMRIDSIEVDIPEDGDSVDVQAQPERATEADEHRNAAAEAFVDKMASSLDD